MLLRQIGEGLVCKLLEGRHAVAAKLRCSASSSNATNFPAMAYPALRRVVARLGLFAWLFAQSPIRRSAAAFLFDWEIAPLALSGLRQFALLTTGRAALESIHKIHDVVATRARPSGNGAAIALLIDQFCESGLIAIFEFARLKVS